MQHVGNLKNAYNEKGVIGGGYSQSKKSNGMNEENSSVYSRNIPFSDSLDDILCSSPENVIDERRYHDHRSDPVDINRKFHFSHESYRDFEEMQDFESDAGVEEIEQFSKDEVEGYHSEDLDPNEEHQSCELEEQGVIKEDNDGDDMDKFFKEIESIEDNHEDSHDNDPKEHRYYRGDNSGRVNTNTGASPKRVTFSEIIQPTGETVIIPKSRSMMRALERISAQGRKQSPVATPKVRKAPTPYNKPIARDYLNLPRSPPMRTPPRASRKPRSHAVSSPEVAKIGSPMRSSPRKSPRKTDGSEEFLTSLMRLSKLGSTPPKVGVKDGRRGLTIPKGPHLRTMAKLSRRNYSSSTSEMHQSPRNYSSPLSNEKKIVRTKTFTMAEMKSKLLEDFRHYSPIQERFVPHQTIPKPFSFLTEERAAFRTLNVHSYGEDHDRSHYRPFKALAMPNYDNDPLFLGMARMSKGGVYTVPEPFQLSVCRRVYAKKAKQIRDDGDIGRYRFKALPVPDFSYKPLGCAHEVNLTVPFPFHLRIDERLVNRIRFHGSKRSNLLANVHVACLIEKAKSADAVEKGDSRVTKTSSLAPVASLKPPTTPRRTAKTFTALPMPNFLKQLSPNTKSSEEIDSPILRGRSKSRATPSSYSSVSSSPRKKTSNSPAASSTKSRPSYTRSYSSSPKSTFKARKIPDFSKPFSPIKKPPSPANSVNRIRSLSPASAFKARKIPNFSKPFSPIKKPPSPVNSMNVMQHISSGTSIATRFSNNSAALTAARPRSTRVSKFEAKRMPDFSNPFVPAKVSPRPVRRFSNSSETSSLGPASQRVSKFEAKRMPDFSKPFVPTKMSPYPVKAAPFTPSRRSQVASVNPMEVSIVTEVRENENRQPLAMKRDDIEFKARLMPNFSKPFLPLKRSTVEEALAKAVEDKNILNLLNQKLNAYKEKLASGEHDESNDKEVQNRIRGMTNEIVHKVLQDFVNTAKSAGVVADYEALSMEFSTESTLNPSQDLSYSAIADADDSSNSSSIYESLSHERINQHLSESTLEESDISLASQSLSAEVGMSYSNEVGKQHSEEKNGSTGRIQSELEEVESGVNTASTIHSDSKAISNDDGSLQPVRGPLSSGSLSPCDRHQGDRDVQEEDQDSSRASSSTILNGDISHQEINNARMVSMIDERSDTLSESCSGSTADVSESVMPLLRIVNRLSETMSKLVAIEKESEKIVSRFSSPIQDNIMMEKESDMVVVQHLPFVPVHITMETKRDKVVPQHPLSILDNITNQISECDVQEKNQACSSTVESQGEGIEVENGDHCIEFRSPRGQFGDDFGSDTDRFRAGWKRALQHVDLRDSPENCIDGTSSKMASLSVITEGLVSAQPGLHNTHDLMSNKVQIIAGHCYKRQSIDSTALDFATKPVNSKSSFFDNMINCCSGKATKSPRSKELQLLEDDQEEYEN